MCSFTHLHYYQLNIPFCFIYGVLYKTMKNEFYISRKGGFVGPQVLYEDTSFHFFIQTF